MDQVIERHYGMEEVKGQSLKVISELVVNEVNAVGRVCFCVVLLWVDDEKE